MTKWALSCAFLHSINCGGACEHLADRASRRRDYLAVTVRKSATASRTRRNRSRPRGTTVQ